MMEAQQFIPRLSLHDFLRESFMFYEVLQKNVL
jgi:hypothetical protein